MLTAAERRAVAALRRKQEREKRGLFVVEGAKLVEEALASGWGVERVFATDAWQPAGGVGVPVRRVSDAELARLSAMESPNRALALVRFPSRQESPVPPRGLTLALAGVRDPGNLGTILRVADWFGLLRVVCSPDCAERFNPKVLQASMGSIFRVTVEERPLAPFLAGLGPDVDVVGATLDGENVYASACREPAVLVLGNESQGIPAELRALLRHRVRIPRGGGAESLNVAAAAAVLCSEWRRGALSRE
jgi:TrmH family RNA methyltransferase